jgi:DNA-directed RNA polymerase subunit M/transcription elongation factor TFIIS
MSKDKFDEAREVLGADKVDNFLACFGLGPKYKPKPEKKYECPKCHGNNAVYREVHPDTDINDIVLICLDCGYSTE